MPIYLGRFEEYQTLTRALRAAKLTVEMLSLLREAAVSVVSKAQETLFSPTRTSENGLTAHNELRELLDALRLYQQMYTAQYAARSTQLQVTVQKLGKMANPADFRGSECRLTTKNMWLETLTNVECILPDVGTVARLCRTYNEEALRQELPAPHSLEPLTRVRQLIARAMPFFACVATLPGPRSQELLEAPADVRQLYSIDKVSRRKAAVLLEKVRQSVDEAVVHPEQNARVWLERRIEDHEAHPFTIGENPFYRPGNLLGIGVLKRAEQEVPCNPPALVLALPVA